MIHTTQGALHSIMVLLHCFDASYFPLSSENVLNVNFGGFLNTYSLRCFFVSYISRALPCVQFQNVVFYLNKILLIREAAKITSNIGGGRRGGGQDWFII